MVWTCDEKRGTLCRRVMQVQRRRKRGRPKRRWLEKVKDDIKEKGLSGRKCTTVLHGGVCHRTSTTHKSGNKMKKKKKKKKQSHFWG